MVLIAQAFQLFLKRPPHLNSMFQTSSSATVILIMADDRNMFLKFKSVVVFLKINGKHFSTVSDREDFLWGPYHNVRGIPFRKKTESLDSRLRQMLQHLVPGGVLPYIRYIGMCRPRGYGF